VKARFPYVNSQTGQWFEEEAATNEEAEAKARDHFAFTPQDQIRVLAFEPRPNGRIAVLVEWDEVA
jgi:hypothetical protein